MRTGPLALLVLLAALLAATGCTTAPTPNTTAAPGTTGPVPNATTERCLPCEAMANATPDANATPAAPFIGTTWEWIALESDGGEPVVATDPANYTVRFTENGTYGVTADCNVGGGDYVLNGDALSLGSPIKTLAWCGDESQDRVFLGSLANVSAFRLEPDGSLILEIPAQGARMLFIAAPVVGPMVVDAPFVNATWRWAERSGSQPLRVPAPEHYTLGFAPDGSFAVRADCNTGTGAYAVEGSSMGIVSPTMTEIACSDKSLDRAFLEALGQVTGYEMVSDDRLALITASPDERLVFERSG